MDHSPNHSPPFDHAPIERVIHDLRTPLAVIKGQTQMLQRRLRQHLECDRDRTLAGLEVIDHMVDRIGATIDALDHDEGYGADTVAGEQP